MLDTQHYSDLTQTVHIMNIYIKTQKLKTAFGLCAVVSFPS